MLTSLRRTLPGPSRSATQSGAKSPIVSCPLKGSFRLPSSGSPAAPRPTSSGATVQPAAVGHRLKATSIAVEQRVTTQSDRAQSDSDRGAGRRVLVACQSVQDAKVSLFWAMSHFVRPGDTVSLVHVAPASELTTRPVRLPSGLLGAASHDDMTPALRIRVEEIEEAAGGKCTRAEVAHDLHVMTEAPGAGKAGVAVALIQAATQLDCDLIVVASGSRGGLTELFSGSVANYLVHHAKRAVAVLHLPRSADITPTLPTAGTKDILVAVDDSEASNIACRWAVDHMYNKGDTVHLMHVIPCLPLTTELSPFDVATPVNPAGVQFCNEMTDKEEQQWRAEQALRFKTIMDSAGANYTLDVIAQCTEVPVETISEDLCRSAVQLDAKALVMCAYSQGPFSQLLFSSVANQVVHHCNHPVIVLHPE